MKILLQKSGAAKGCARIIAAALAMSATLSLVQPIAAQVVESGPKTYPAGNTVVPASGYTSSVTTSGSVSVPNGANVTYQATGEVRLQSGFSVTGGGTFHAQIVTDMRPVITSSLTADGTVDSAFSYQITASNDPTSYNATGLPDGLGVNTGNGVISGTPTQSGTFNITISATNSFGTGSDTLVLTIDPAPPVITSSATASGTVGSAFSYQITATNDPTSYGASGLAPGLSVNTGTGAITGTPTSSGTYNATISATNAGGTGNAGLQITVNPPPPQDDTTNQNELEIHLPVSP